MTCVSVLIKVSTNVQEDCCCMQYVSGWITVMQLRVAHSWNSGFGGLICSFPLHYLYNSYVRPPHQKLANSQQPKRMALTPSYHQPAR